MSRIASAVSSDTPRNALLVDPAGEHDAQRMGAIVALARRIDWSVVGLIIAAKLIALTTIALAYRAFPFLSWTYYAALHYPPHEPISLLTAYKTWDAQHYLYLSQVGYHRGGPSNDYYPLFPALIHVAALVVRSSLAAGLLVSNLCSLIGLYILYLFTFRLFGERRMAVLCLLFLLAFPTGFFLSLAYSESLFLLLAVCFFYYLYQGNYPLCSTFAFLLPLARPLGVLIVLPWLVYHFAAGRAFGRAALPARNIRRRGGHARRPGRRSVARIHLTPVLGAAARPRYALAYILAPLAGYAAYLLYLYVATGDPFSAFTQEQSSLGAWHVADLLRPDLLVNNFLLPFNVSLPDFGLTAPTASPLDRLYFLLFLLGLPLVLIETDLVLFSLYVLLGSVPLLGSFMSYSRYLMPAFPLYIAAARFATMHRMRVLPACWLLVSVAAALILLARHALNYWVA